MEIKSEKPYSDLFETEWEDHKYCKKCGLELSKDIKYYNQIRRTFSRIKIRNLM
jgi:hypothetical protein